MAELTHAEYNDLSILDSNRWLEYRGDEAVFLDPATGNQLRGDEPPQWLQADPRLARGYELLGEANANGHKLTIAYCAHSNAYDLDLPRAQGTPDRQWYERMHRDIAAVALERLTTRESVQKRVDAYRDSPVVSKRSVTFVERQHRAIADHGVPFLLPDVATDSEVPIDRLLFEGLCSVRDYLLEKDKRISFEQARDLYFPLQNMREWYLPAKYMIEAEAQREKMGEEPVVLFPLGARHTDVTRKYAVLGMKVDELHLLQSMQRRTECLEYARVSRTGRVAVAAMVAESASLATRTAVSRRAAAPRQRRIH